MLEEHKLKKALNVLRAITHPLRLSILTTIDKSKVVSVNNLHSEMKIDLSLLSQNLKILKSANLVNTKREGKFIYYSVNYERITDLKEVTHSFFG